MTDRLLPDLHEGIHYEQVTWDPLDLNGGIMMSQDGSSKKESAISRT